MNGTKIMLFDVDGVLINLPNYFSKELSEEGYGNAQESLNSFYHGEESRQCSEGKAEAERSIMPYLEKFGWTGSAGNILSGSSISRGNIWTRIWSPWWQNSGIGE